MDEKSLQFEQYTDAVRSGQLCLDALERIVKHDKASLWSHTPGGLARAAVVKCCQDGLIVPMKLKDQVGDLLYGNEWPLPLQFSAK